MIKPFRLRYLVIYILIILIFLPRYLGGQSASATYMGGDIPTSYQVHDPACNGTSNQLLISFDAPGTFTVTGIDVSWDFEAIAPGLISHQASRLYFVNSGIQSDRFSQEIGEPGVHTYTMTNDPLINGTYEGPVDLVFELWAWRRDEISEEDGCGTRFNKVNDRSWTLTVHYTYSPPTLANIYLGGNGDGYDHNFKTGLNPFVPPALASIYFGGLGDGYDHDFQMGLNPYVPPVLASIYFGGLGDGYNHDFQMGLNPYAPPALASIYRGGSGDGYDHDFQMGLNPYAPPALASIYRGGSGDGYDHDFQMGLNTYAPPALASIYLGGLGDGYDHDIQIGLNPYVPPTLANVYRGGSGDGYDHDFQIGLNLYVPPTLAGIYRGGVGDGYDIHYSRFLNPNCLDGVVFWTGSTDTNWFNLSNWDCGELPAASSHVIITRNVPHYPYVTGDDVIADLTLQHNTTIRFSNNILFRTTSNQ